jgi:hypothetical protein
LMNTDLYYGSYPFPELELGLWWMWPVGRGCLLLVTWPPLLIYPEVCVFPIL